MQRSRLLFPVNRLSSNKTPREVGQRLAAAGCLQFGELVKELLRASDFRCSVRVNSVAPCKEFTSDFRCSVRVISVAPCKGYVSDFRLIGDLCARSNSVVHLREAVWVAPTEFSSMPGAEN